MTCSVHELTTWKNLNGLQNIVTRMGFPCLSHNVVIDAINLPYSNKKVGVNGFQFSILFLKSSTLIFEKHSSRHP